MKNQKTMFDTQHIDRDAELIGFDPKVWKEFKEMYVQDDLPNMLKAEAEVRESSISQETKEDFNNRLSLRWIKYNELEKNADKQHKLLRQYMMISKMHRSR